MQVTLNIEATIAAALESALSPDRLRETIEKKVSEVADRAIADAFSSYGEFGKTVKTAIAELLPHSVNIDGAASFQHIISRVISDRIAAVNDERMRQALDPMLRDLLVAAPATIKLSELVDQALEQWKSWHDYSSDFGQQPTIIVEREASSITGSLHHRIYMDWREGKSKYSCGVSMALHGEPGEVYSLEFDKKPAGEKLFVGPLYSFERTLFHLYTGKTKIVVDRTDFDDVYWPGQDD